ncbi:hypothetical protein NDU88_006189 [Pleurodeles waltl]|uniref:Uncharacterized protein n=1 Tax=Pleurodeles waltl TaxID=8319 RepID=A0AAV7X0U8_PLEWA|nr:hypothetical protein NDU88_006189 [Pleurodeles waltl]
MPLAGPDRLGKRRVGWRPPSRHVRHPEGGEDCRCHSGAADTTCEHHCNFRSVQKEDPTLAQAWKQANSNEEEDQEEVRTSGSPTEKKNEGGKNEKVMKEPVLKEPGRRRIPEVNTLAWEDMEPGDSGERKVCGARDQLVHIQCMLDSLREGAVVQSATVPGRTMVLGHSANPCTSPAGCRGSMSVFGGSGCRERDASRGSATVVAAVGCSSKMGVPKHR